MNISQRANQLLSLANFAHADQLIESAQLPASALSIPTEQYVLRMMVHTPEYGLCVPPELYWLFDTILVCIKNQALLNKHHPFIYVTVRSGIVSSTTDDEWHVDGFSMRTPHVPEQNYVWTNCYPTEHLAQKFVIPDDFDPMRHNIHHFFQDNAGTNIRQMACEQLHLIDPYIVHRRPKVPIGTRRTFFRISFVPIEIEDDTCTPNPLLPARVYGRPDIRKTLTRY
jgi:hypothetical protein